MDGIILDVLYIQLSKISVTFTSIFTKLFIRIYVLIDIEGISSN